MEEEFISLISIVALLLLLSLFAAFASSSISLQSVYAEPLSFKSTGNTSSLERTGPSQFIGVKPINPSDLPREAREQPSPLIPPDK